MGSPKIHQQNIRRLTKLGGQSFGITLPIAMIRKFRWRGGQKLVVRARGRKLIVEDWKR